MSRPTAAERFFAKIDRNVPAPAHAAHLGPCWTWTGSTDSNGCGRIYVNGRKERVHRLMFHMVMGEIAEGMVIDHLCHRHECAAPWHIRAVTPKQNAEHRLGATRTKGRTSIYRGVSWHRRVNAWQATVRHNGRKVHGGYHSTPEAAHKAAQALRRRLFTHSDLDTPRGPENGAQPLAGAGT